MSDGIEGVGPVNSYQQVNVRIRISISSMRWHRNTVGRAAYGSPISIFDGGMDLDTLIEQKYGGLCGLGVDIIS